MMNICLKTHAKQVKSEHIVMHINDRLPVFIHSPCELACEFKVEAHRNYYLLVLNVKGELNLTCQRCMEDFQYAYHNQSQLAVCVSDEVAETLMSSYECILSDENEVNLVDIITDELHLYCPERHEDLTMCHALIG